MFTIRKKIRIPEARIPRRRAGVPYIDIIGTDEFNKIFDDMFKDFEMPLWELSVDDVDEDDDNDSGDDGMDDGGSDGDDSSAGVDDEVTKIPPSIFDYLENGGKFEDLFSNGFRNIEPPKPKEEVKNPFVFIANRLTFLIKTRHPIIWDTSSVDTINDRFIFVAFDKERNPMLNMKMASEIAASVNYDREIQGEIDNYLEDTKWKQIYCAPHTMDINGENRMGFVFAVIPREEND